MWNRSCAIWALSHVANWQSNAVRRTRIYVDDERIERRVVSDRQSRSFTSANLSMARLEMHADVISFTTIDVPTVTIATSIINLRHSAETHRSTRRVFLFLQHSYSWKWRFTSPRDAHLYARLSVISTGCYNEKKNASSCTRVVIYWKFLKGLSSLVLFCNKTPN